MSGELSILLTFFAGLLSFLSPCVLPLIPSYLGILGGVGLGEQSQDASGSKFRLLLTASGFVLGFSAVFITFGILISASFFFMGGISAYINLAAGIIVIILGLNIIFDFVSFLNYEKRPFLGRLMSQDNKIHLSIAAAFFAGAAFGAGWTPCIGPVLTGILTLAGQGGQIPRAVFFLAVYSAGLALPFLLAALFFDVFLKGASRLRPRMRLIQRISGILLIIIGIMILTGRYSALNMLIQRWIFDYINWAEDKALLFRLLADILSWQQGF